MVIVRVAKNGKPVVVETSWDDGVQLDFKLAEMLRRYKLPAVFYIPNCCELTHEEIKKLGEDFEIGGHTVTHPDNLGQLNEPTQAMEIFGNKMWLEGLLWREIDKFCYPRGRKCAFTPELVRKAGFLEARTTLVLSTEIAAGKQVFEKKTSVHAYQRKEYGQESWEDVACRLMDEVFERGGNFHLWGHSNEINRDGNWESLKRIFERLAVRLYE